MDMSLSFRITSRSVSITPALLRASNAIPDDMALPPAGFAFQFRALRHAERGAHRGTRMGGAERVVLALAAAREAGNPSAHAYAAHRFAAAGENLVRIGLVSHVPDDAVVRRVEYVVQRDGQLDRPQI